MKYIPKEIKGNVNVSSQSPMKDFWVTVFKLLGVLLAVYIILGMILDFMAPRISLKMEQKIGVLLSQRFLNKQNPAGRDNLQKILDNLLVNASLPALNYQVYINDAKEPNALALPGGSIIVFTPLLKEIESENELAMVLAHELGHFAHRDHLRGMGRGLVFIVLSTVTLGADNPVSRFIGNALVSVEMRFSRVQEQSADLFAVDLLQKTYGNAAGAVDFLAKMAAKEKLGRVFFFFASHPYTPGRIRAIESRIREKGYSIGEKIPAKYF